MGLEQKNNFEDYIEAAVQKAARHFTENLEYQLIYGMTKKEYELKLKEKLEIFGELGTDE